MRWVITIVSVVVVVAALVAGLVVMSARPAAPATQPVASVPATSPSTSPATKPQTFGPRVQTYTDFLRTLPGMTEVTLADDRLPIAQSAAMRIASHVYICPRHDLWLTHADAPSITTIPQEQLLKQQTHLTSERVVYVHWQRIGRQLRCIPVIRDEVGAYQLLVPRAKPVKLERFDYHWLKGTNSGEMIVAPTDQGIAVITIKGKEVTQQYRQISTDENATPQIAMTGKGFIAWLPPAFMAAEGTVLRYADGQFVDNFAQGPWAGPFLHLVPFADGNVLQVAPAGQPGKVRLTIVPLETTPADPREVRKLLDRLGDEDGAIRAEAHAHLAAMGPSAWDVIEKSLPTLAAEPRVRAEQIIAARAQPRLGRFALIEDTLRPIWRLADGGVVMLAEQGVLTTRDDPNEKPTVPAWVCIRPGYTVSLLPPALTRWLSIGNIDLDVVGSDWIVSDENEGARIFFGQELQAITREADRNYRFIVGVDNDGRILLAQRPAEAEAKAIKPDYLLIDPRLADPTPVLPVWTMTIAQGEVGWDKDHWPAIKRGQPWSLHEDAWENLKGEIIKSVGTPPTITHEQQSLTEIASDDKGTTFYSNRASLAVKKDGRLAIQPRPTNLPPSDLAAVYARDRLYILHSHGKLSRLKVDPQSASPFAVDTVFTENIPSVSEVSRMWVDPAGRLCIAADGDRVIIIFVGKKIPQAIQDIIPSDELKQARP